MKFTAFERSKQGTGASRRLRISGRTPGIVYGGTATPQLVELDHNALWHALKKEAFHSSVLTMQVGETESPVLLRDVQVHPFKQLVLHVDFQRVDASTKLHMKVPLHFVGDELSPAIKSEGCIANHVISEIEVMCLPADLKKGSSLHLAEIPMPKGVSVVARGANKNPVVVSVVAVAGAEVEAAPAPAAAAAPAADAKAAAKPAAKAPAAKPAAKK